MTSDTPTESRGRGRPRDDERTAAILEATHHVLKNNGWDDLRVADVAEEAGCGLATIYRRWETKEELVAACMRARPLPPLAETGDARVDLSNMLVAVGGELMTMGEATLGFLAAARRDPVLRDALLNNVMTVTRPRLARYLGEIIDADDRLIAMVGDALAGALLFRLGVVGDLESPEAFADEAMALVERLA